MRINEILNIHRELRVKIVTEPSCELLAGARTGHELGGRSNTYLEAGTGELMAGSLEPGMEGWLGLGIEMWLDSSQSKPIS